MSLREITADKHREAENTELMQSMIDGSITDEMYAKYLTQMGLIYARLETIVVNVGLYDDLGGIFRTHRIQTDLAEMTAKINKEFGILESTDAYITHLGTISSQPNKVIAHVYVRHMGDMSGGQILKEKVPGSGTWYDFTDVESFKEKIRGRLTEKSDIVDEVNKAFDLNIAMFKEICDVEKNGRPIYDPTKLIDASNAADAPAPTVSFN